MENGKVKKKMTHLYVSENEVFAGDASSSYIHSSVGF